MQPKKVSINDYLKKLNQYSADGGWPSKFERSRFLKDAQKIQKTDACRAFTLQGAIASLDGDSATAVTFHRKAVQVGPNSIVARSNYATSLVNLGMSISALEQSRAAYHMAKNTKDEDFPSLAERYVRQLVLCGYAEEALSVIEDSGEIMTELWESFKEDAEAINQFCNEHEITAQDLAAYNSVTEEIMSKAHVTILSTLLMLLLAQSQLLNFATLLIAMQKEQPNYAQKLPTPFQTAGCQKTQRLAA